jgi:glyoxylase-like metal-dependent hydrolase (beta-lactamase superfamily II)
VTRVELPGHDIVAIRAPNPGPYTLTGTNSWLVGRGPAWLIDPGPDLPAHVEALAAEARAREGLGGIAITHDHADHAQAVSAVRERYPLAPVAAASGGAQVRLADGIEFGPLRALAMPGHAPDHFGFAFGEVLFTGDAILGHGSSLITPYPGALRAYLEALERLREQPFAVFAPGHGDPIADPQAKLEEYIHHRHERERRLIDALEAGRRTVDELLEHAWSDAPPALRPAAAATLAAHLDKLEQDGRLPAGVERPGIYVEGAEAGAEPGV